MLCITAYLCRLFEEEVWKRLADYIDWYFSLVANLNSQFLVTTCYVYVKWCYSFDKNQGPECILGIRAHVLRTENLNQRLGGSALEVVGHIQDTRCRYDQAKNITRNESLLSSQKLGKIKLFSAVYFGSFLLPISCPKPSWSSLSNL